MLRGATPRRSGRRTRRRSYYHSLTSPSSTPRLGVAAAVELRADSPRPACLPPRSPSPSRERGSSFFRIAPEPDGGLCGGLCGAVRRRASTSPAILRRKWRRRGIAEPSKEAAASAWAGGSTCRREGRQRQRRAVVTRRLQQAAAAAAASAATAAPAPPASRRRRATTPARLCYRCKRPQPTCHTPNPCRRCAPLRRLRTLFGRRGARRARAAARTLCKPESLDANSPRQGRRRLDGRLRDSEASDFVFEDEEDATTRLAADAAAAAAGAPAVLPPSVASSSATRAAGILSGTRPYAGTRRSSAAAKSRAPSRCRDAPPGRPGRRRGSPPCSPCRSRRRRRS